MVIEERIANTALTMSWRQSKEFRHQPLRQFTSRIHKVRSKPDGCAPYTDQLESTLLAPELSARPGVTWAAPIQAAVAEVMTPFKMQTIDATRAADLVAGVFGNFNPASYVRFKAQSSN